MQCSDWAGLRMTVLIIRSLTTTSVRQNTSEKSHIVEVVWKVMPKKCRERCCEWAKNQEKCCFFEAGGNAIEKRLSVESCCKSSTRLKKVCGYSELEDLIFCGYLKSANPQFFSGGPSVLHPVDSQKRKQAARHITY